MPLSLNNMAQHTNVWQTGKLKYRSSKGRHSSNIFSQIPNMRYVSYQTGWQSSSFFIFNPENHQRESIKYRACILILLFWGVHTLIPDLSRATGTTGSHTYQYQEASYQNHVHDISYYPNGLFRACNGVLV